MKKVNEMISGLYLRNKDTMKMSGPSAILFISKITFCLLIFSWIFFLGGLFGRIFANINIISLFPKGRYALLPHVIIVYFVVNYFTWKKDQILKFIDNEENKEDIKRAVWLFWGLTIIGMLLAVSVGYYNKWHPLPE